MEHLVSLDRKEYQINYRESYIFTSPTDIEDENNTSALRQHQSGDRALSDNIDQSLDDSHMDISTELDTLNDLKETANTQQKYLIDFVQDYLDHLLKHSRRPHQTSKPKPFHIVVNGLAGSGKSYVISIIEKMLQNYCISESTTVSRARKNFGLLKVAHTGKAALNIHGSTIHSALEIVTKALLHPFFHLAHFFFRHQMEAHLQIS